MAIFQLNSLIFIFLVMSCGEKPHLQQGNIIPGESINPVSVIPDSADGTNSNNADTNNDDTNNDDANPPTNPPIEAKVQVTINPMVYYSCSLAATGKIKCWGHGASQVNLGGGKLPEGVLGSTQPVDVKNIDSAVKITRNGSPCALLKSGGIMCWGYNGEGQVGDGTKEQRGTPVPVKGITTAIDVSSSNYNTCALLQSSEVMCWGHNRYGQLGNGSTINSYLPVKVKNLTDAIAIEVGQFHACALLKNKKVKCWGQNNNGELGNNTKIDSPLPQDVIGLSGVKQLSVGSTFACALLENSTVKCWGGKYNGVMGDGTIKDDRLAPTNIVKNLVQVKEITSGGSHACALEETGKVKCWGFNGQPNLARRLGIEEGGDKSIPVDVLNLDSVKHISAGSHTCAILTSGKAKCWGSNFGGQLGTGDKEPSNIPVDVTIAF